jgi:integrase
MPPRRSVDRSPSLVVALRAWLTEQRAVLDRLESILGKEAAQGETLDAWAERWFDHRDVADLAEERATYARIVPAEIRARPAASLTRSDAEGIVESLDDLVRDGAIRGRTAQRYWSTIRTMLGDMARSKTRALRIREDSIVRDVRPPDAGDSRSSTFLYPRELLALVGCERVPLEDRRAYALAVYLYPRAGELAAITWEDVDLATGRVHVHRSVDRETGEVGGTKTGMDRQFVAERAVMPMLRGLARVALPGPIVTWRRNNASVRLRAHLRWAGCRRADLHADDERRRPLTFHDLRATGVTWQAMRGDPATAIVERVGHANLATTERYMRRGRLMAIASGERVFPALPRALWVRSK